jgi:hypothetical protein
MVFKTPISRRAVMVRIGGGGLALAGAMFGFVPNASAALCKRGCCTLANCPNIDYQKCVATKNMYAWRCYYSSGIRYQCSCCETPGNTYSAYACWPA